MKRNGRPARMVRRQELAAAAVWFAVLVVVAGDVPRPRGVPLARASFYNPAKDFTCFDGHGTIPFGQVNDDYCDCLDGSDEPGTSACINGVFYCTNAGHRALAIPSSRVNDGICDCCDGTDEYTGAHCQDICEELGREAKLEAQKRAELVKNGGLLRQQLIASGNEKRSEMAKQLVELEKDKDEAERIKAEKEMVKNELESKENDVLKVYREADEKEKAKKDEEEKAKNEMEAKENFEKFDSNGDGLLTLDEIQTRTTFDKNRDGQIDEEEARYFLSENDQVNVETFISDCWSRIKPFLMIDQGLFKPSVEKEGGEEFGEGHQDGAEEELDTEAEGEDLDHEEPETESPRVEETVRTYDPQTQEIVDAATDARRQHSEADRTLREIDSKIRHIKESLEKDYGPQHEFATLDGTCAEYEDKEYIYKLCLFGTVVQKAKSGDHDVSLGNWGEWVGEEGNRYSAMKYSGGQSCWNGPNRSTHVIIDCGLENKLMVVSEPSRCEYLMEFHTPAACDDNRLVVEPHPHDEL